MRRRKSKKVKIENLFLKRKKAASVAVTKTSIGSFMSPVGRKYMDSKKIEKLKNKKKIAE